MSQRVTDEEIKELRERACCLVPKPGVMLPSSHERDFCGCEVNRLLDSLEEARRERDKLKEHKQLLFEENGRLLSEKESGQWDKNMREIDALRTELARVEEQLGLALSDGAILKEWLEEARRGKSVRDCPDCGKQMASVKENFQAPAEVGGALVKDVPLFRCECGQTVLTSRGQAHIDQAIRDSLLVQLEEARWRNRSYEVLRVEYLTRIQELAGERNTLRANRRRTLARILRLRSDYRSACRAADREARKVVEARRERDVFKREGREWQQIACDKDDQLKDLRADLAEEQRLNSMGSEREARLMAQVEELRRDSAYNQARADKLAADNLELRRELARLQRKYEEDMTRAEGAFKGEASRASALRAKLDAAVEALEAFFHYFDPDTESYPGEKEYRFNEFTEKAREALAKIKGEK